MEDTQHLDTDVGLLDLDDIDHNMNSDPVERALKEKGYNLLKWSIEQVKKCDVMVHLFNDRIGSMGLELGQPSTHYEMEAAYELDRPILAYDLITPFEDDAKLLESHESMSDLEKTRGSRFSLSDGIKDKMLSRAARPVNRLFFTGMNVPVTRIKSVTDLSSRVVVDIIKTISKLRSVCPD